MSSYYFSVADDDMPSSTRLKQFAKDSRRALASRGKLRRNLIKGHLASILNRMTLTNSSTSILALIGAGLLASHCVYA